MSVKNIFKYIYENNSWGSNESVSGAGSQLNETEKIRKEIPFVIDKFGIKTILDIPCGDFNWMSKIELTNIGYIGADIVDELIAQNRIKYPDFRFEVMDLITDELPQVDLIIVRDCLGHLSNQNIFSALKNIRKSGSKYLLTTTFPTVKDNFDVINGGWKPINLLMSPFSLTPIHMILEELPYSDKSLFMFDIQKNINF